MPRILTGIQSTGIPHLGNLLGVILPTIRMAQLAKDPLYLFIADLHSLTQIKDAQLIKKNTYELASAWIACGLPIENCVFYKQSDMAEVSELTWYLSCFFSYQRLSLAHGFKDKVDRLQDVNAGLFTYPILMAADILLYDAQEIPVGKDQIQHIEIARDIAEKFNKKMGDTFLLPQARLQPDSQYVLGRDGHKMSKSRNNFIDIFAPESILKKQIMSIKTDAQPIEASKDPTSCIVFQIYKLLASKEDSSKMKEKFLAGGYGYGQAKEALYMHILEKFSSARNFFDQLIKDQAYLDEVLEKGAQKAKETAFLTLNRVRERLGFNKKVKN